MRHALKGQTDGPGACSRPSWKAAKSQKPAAAEHPKGLLQAGTVAGMRAVRAGPRGKVD